MAVKLLSAEATIAVVMGASDWRSAGMPNAPSFERAANGVLRLLSQRGTPGLGLDPSLILNFFNDRISGVDQLANLRDKLDHLLRERQGAGHPIADLLFYYIGHGVTDNNNHLTLLIAATRKGMENVTGIRVTDLAHTLRIAAPKQRRIVILDCCFSEAAARSFIGMGGNLSAAVAAGVGKDLARETPGRGGLLLCSSPAGEVSIGEPESKSTLFTGAFLDVVENGAEGVGDRLSFADLTEAIYDRMIASFGSEAPRPALHQFNQTQGDLSRIPVFENVGGVAFREKMAAALAMIGKNDELMLLLLEGLKRDEPWAKVRLGHMFRLGKHGVVVDHELAEGFYRQAANQEDPAGQAFYGLYLSEKGEKAEALRYIQMSAARNNRDGQFLLAQRYMEGGEGLPQSPQKAVELWKQAAAQECGPAMSMLALCHMEGLAGLEKDLAKAETLLLQAKHIAPVFESDGGELASQFLERLQYMKRSKTS